MCGSSQRPLPDHIGLLRSAYDAVPHASRTRERQLATVPRKPQELTGYIICSVLSGGSATYVVVVNTVVCIAVKMLFSSR